MSEPGAEMPAGADVLGELFPDTDHAFRLTLRRCQPAEFFRRGGASDAILTERSRWLDEAPDRCVQALPEATAAIDEFAAEATRWPEASRLDPGPPVEPREQLLAMGRQWEADVLFLTSGANGEFRLRGGVLCFPTGWSLEEKLGESLESIHAPVPGLNAAIGGAMGQFMAKLKPGAGFLRRNWGLAATAELNLHPARKVAPPGRPVRLAELWLRVEHQILLSLPRTGAVVFGIKIEQYRMDRVAMHPAAPRMRRALVSMDEELASYKRIAEIRGELIKLLC